MKLRCFALCAALGLPLVFPIGLSAQNVIGTMDVTPAKTPHLSGNILGFSMSASTPINMATGTASGKRQHNPISITRAADANTASFVTMASTNETIKKLSIKIGQLTYTMTNAVVVNQAIVAGTFDPASGGAAIEELQFTYQKLEIDYVGKAVATDDWNL